MHPGTACTTFGFCQFVSIHLVLVLLLSWLFEFDSSSPLLSSPPLPSIFEKGPSLTYQFDASNNGTKYFGVGNKLKLVVTASNSLEEKLNYRT